MLTLPLGAGAFGMGAVVDALPVLGAQPAAADVDDKLTMTVEEVPGGKVVTFYINGAKQAVWVVPDDL